MRSFAERVEALGFDSLWVTDHVIVPKELTIVYKEKMLDALAMLNYLAAVTRRVAIGTSVIILPYRNPITVAKEVATADVLSGGRVIFGAAAGWMEGEFRALNADFEHRGDVSDEALGLIRALWSAKEPAFTGARYRIEGMAFSPQTVQSPHPPIWVGGGSKRAIRRAVEYGDGWHPNIRGFDDLQDAVGYMRELSKRHGRATPPLLSLRTQVSFEGGDPARGGLHGTPVEMAEAIERYRGLGVEHLIISFPESPFGEHLDMLERFAAEVKPLVQ